MEDYKNILHKIQEKKHNKKIKLALNNFDKNLDEECCTLCNSYNVVQIDGYYTCRDCGNHNTNVINCEQEWRFYGQFDNKSTDPARCGMPVSDLIPNVSMGSVICSNWNSSYDVKRIKKIQSWNSITYRDMTLMNAFQNMTNVANQAGIPNYILEEAKHMFKSVNMIKSYRKAKKAATQAASIQLACRIKGFPRNSNEMANYFGISLKDMRKGAKQFEELWSIVKRQKENLELEENKQQYIIDKLMKQNNNSFTKDNQKSKDQFINQPDNQPDNQPANQPAKQSTSDLNNNSDLSNIPKINIDSFSNSQSQASISELINFDILSFKANGKQNENNYKPSASTDFLHRCCSKLNLSDDIFNICMQICEYIEREDYLIKHIPLSRTAGCIYFTCCCLNIDINKSEINSICNVSEVTINKCYHKLMKIKDDLVNNTDLKLYIF